MRTWHPTAAGWELRDPKGNVVAWLEKQYGRWLGRVRPWSQPHLGPTLSLDKAMKCVAEFFVFADEEVQRRADQEVQRS